MKQDHLLQGKTHCGLHDVVADGLHGAKALLAVDAVDKHVAMNTSKELGAENGILVLCRLWSTLP